jgi:mono/diheme cytochrome c family protein
MPNLEHYYKKKIDELKAQPVKIFALVYPYILIAGLVLGVIYANNLSQVARATVPAGVPDTTKETDLKVVEPRVVPPVDIMTVSQPSPELISKGENVFNTICQSCHGADGLGTGTGSAGLNPPPRNFTNAEGWKNGPKLTQIYKTLQEGIPGSAMVAYDYLLPEEKIGLAHYIRQTFIPNAPQDTQDDLVLLDQTYQLSKGQVISAQIPLESAVKIVTAEHNDEAQKIINIIGQISADRNSGGAVLFEQVTNNKAAALTTLMRAPGWKEGVQQFAHITANNVNTNGFNGRVLNLNSNEWSTLQNYLLKYF